MGCRLLLPRAGRRRTARLWVSRLKGRATVAGAQHLGLPCLPRHLNASAPAAEHVLYPAIQDGSPPAAKDVPAPARAALRLTTIATTIATTTATMQRATLAPSTRRSTPWTAPWCRARYPGN